PSWNPVRERVFDSHTGKAPPLLLHARGQNYTWYYRYQRSLPGSSCLASFPFHFFLLVLSIICVCAVFSVVMFILKILRCRFHIRIDHLTAGCHLGNFFQNNGVMYRL